MDARIIAALVETGEEAGASRIDGGWDEPFDGKSQRRFSISGVTFHRSGRSLTSPRRPPRMPVRRRRSPAAPSPLPPPGQDGLPPRPAPGFDTFGSNRWTYTALWPTTFTST